MIPLISVCIPAYNRVKELEPLLLSVLEQDFTDFEVIICEDVSPEQPKIRSLVESLQNPKIRYFENENNLGYDGNLRRLIEKASGKYCFFMGNDDLMCPGALSKVASAVSRYQNVGVVLRSYAAFSSDPKKPDQTFKYFSTERFFPAGIETIATFFRRSVVIPGLVIERESALRVATNRFDGTLLYQLYLVGRILQSKNGVFLPDILVLYRNGGTPDFGHSATETGKFVPGKQTPESSLHFIRGFLEIAQAIEKEEGQPVFKPIFSDLGNYSYPLLSVQANKSKAVFLKYGINVAKMGFWKHPLFWGYFASLLTLGSSRSNKIIGFIKNQLGHTPRLGKVYQGS